MNRIAGRQRGWRAMRFSLGVRVGWQKQQFWNHFDRKMGDRKMCPRKGETVPFFCRPSFCLKEWNRDDVLLTRNSYFCGPGVRVRAVSVAPAFSLTRRVHLAGAGSIGAVTSAIQNALLTLRPRGSGLRCPAAAEPRPRPASSGRGSPGRRPGRRRWAAAAPAGSSNTSSFSRSRPWRTSIRSRLPAGRALLDEQPPALRRR